MRQRRPIGLNPRRALCRFASQLENNSPGWTGNLDGHSWLGYCTSGIQTKWRIHVKDYITGWMVSCPIRPATPRLAIETVAIRVHHMSRLSRPRRMIRIVHMIRTRRTGKVIESLVELTVEGHTTAELIP